MQDRSYEFPRRLLLGSWANGGVPYFRVRSKLSDSYSPVEKCCMNKQLLTFLASVLSYSVRVRPFQVAAWSQQLTLLRGAQFPPALSRSGSKSRDTILRCAEVWRERARFRVYLRRLRPSVRPALLPVFSDIVGGFLGGSVAEDLDGPLELLGGDFASGEALP